MHDYHDALPGYDPEQLLHDGCTECEARATYCDHGISKLDSQNFARAWRRAYHWNVGGTGTQISDAERPMLTVLWSVQLQLERRGVPIGHLPPAGNVLSFW